MKGLLLLLCAATTLLLLLTLPGIDMGGDAAWKWAFVRSWGRGLPWVYDHHTARFAVNVPIFVSQRLFGTHVNVMYVAPLCFGVLQIALVYACGARLCSPAVGLVAAALLLAFEPWTNAASQLLPGVFQSAYLLAALLCYSEHARSGQRRWLLALGLCMLLAYGAMITSVYFVPGFVLAVWWLRKRFLDNLLWLVVLGAGIALETLVYAWQSDFPFGHLQIIRRTHTNVEPIAFWGLFRRYAVLPLVWQLGLALSGLGALILPWATRSRALQGLCLLIASGLVALTFGVKQLQPLVPALNFRDRYFDPFAPLLALALAACVQEVLRKHVAPRVVIALLVCEVAALIALRGMTGPEQLARNAEHQRVLSQTYLNARPIVGDSARDHDQVKTLSVIAYAFFSDEAFWAQPDVRRPRLQRTEVRNRSYRFLSRVTPEPKPLRHAIIKKECVVFAARRGSARLRVDVTGCSDYLPPR